MELSPQQLHYFKRELISLELCKELEAFKQERLSSVMQTTKLPLLHFLFDRLVRQFPLLEKSQDKFWTQAEEFWTVYQQLTLDTYRPLESASSLGYRLNHLMVIALTGMIKTVHGNEESIRAVRDMPANDIDLAELESEENYLTWIGGSEGPDLDVIMVRKKTHDEFLVQTDNTIVSRRYGQFRQLRNDLKSVALDEEMPYLPGKARDPSYGNTDGYLYREKDRISLRLFLRKVAAVTVMAQSKHFQQFLTDDPITLTKEEQLEVQERLGMDKKREEEEKEFKRMVDKKIVELDDLLQKMKEKITQPKGLLDVFDTIKKTEKINQLPDELKKAIEWGRLNFAFVLHTQFVTSDKAVENVANLKRTHSLMPYRAVAQILKLSNPFAMIKGIMDLFLAQPFGQKSLFQRIVMASMNDEIKEMQQDIEQLELKIDDPILCRKLSNAVKLKRQDDVPCFQDPILETLNVLKIPHIEPILTAEQILKVAFANQPDQKESKELVQSLYQLWLLYGKRHEQDIITQIVFQGETSELIKNLFALFYEPLAQVYRQANIGDSVNQVAVFIERLIKLIDSVDVKDVTNTSQGFIGLVKDHEQDFYFFVHNVHAKDTTNVFNGLLNYVDSVFMLVTQGLSKKIDLDVCVQRSIGKENYPQLIEEIDRLCAYHKECKEHKFQQRRQEMAKTEEEYKEFSGVLSDFEDLDHQLKIPLTWIPRISPLFIEQLIFEKII